MNRYQRSLLLLIAAATVASWIRAPYRDQMVLQHIPTAVVLIFWLLLARRFPLTNTAAACLASFMILHVVGARYLYSYVPYDDWARAICGVDLTSIFHFRRNHFDRLVHFSFGALWVRPTWEICVRYFRVPRRFAYYTAFEFVLAFSMLYELVEWGLSMALAPADADAYNGQQGDMWDAQKDMSFALLGALLALVLLAVTQRSRAAVLNERSAVKSLLSIFVLSLLLTGPAFSARGPSTPEERQKAVEQVKVLETAPWSDEAKEARAWLTAFLNEVPDITVKKCLSLLGSAAERQGIPADLQMQHMFSSAAYLLEHPGAGAGSTEAFLAGLEGTLKSYSALRAHNSIEPQPRLEQLLQIQKEGQLEAYVRGQGRNCL